MNNTKETIKDLTLMLLYLTSWDEKEFSQEYRRSWKGYDFDTLNELSDDGLIIDSRRSKSIYLDETGIQRAKALLTEYGIDAE